MNAETLPLGFQLVRGWARDVRLEDVRAAVPWQQERIRVYGKEHDVPRMTCWMADDGRAYTYSGVRQTTFPLTFPIVSLRERVELEAGARFNSVLANLYRDGSDSAAWHADDEPELGLEPVIASLSLGAARAFAIRRNATHERWRVELGHGDLLVMSGPSQREYQHAVPKTQRAVASRINLTFRTVR